MECCLSNELDEWINKIGPKFINETKTTQSKKSYQLDLFKEILPAIDRGDKTYFRNLTEEEQKSIEPWIIMRWMSSSESDKDQIDDVLNANYFVNDNYSSITTKKTSQGLGHKELQWLLLTLCGKKRYTKRRFLKPPKHLIKNLLEQELLKIRPELKNSDIQLLLKIYTREDFRIYFENHGFQKKHIEEILNSDTRIR